MQIQPVARLCGVSKRYRAGATEVAALSDVSLEIRPRSFTMLVGPSGSGKTTLLNMLGCIDRPTSGSVEVAGQVLDRMSDDQLTDFRAQRIGFVFQNFNLIPVLTAYENIEYPLLMLRLSAAERRARTLELLDAVGLSDRRDQRPGELSGGQKQRVAIARALIKRPEIVLADEPTANLDSRTGESIVELLREMQSDFGTSFIFSTHDKDLMSHADDIVQIRDGRLVVPVLEQVHEYA